ncbi:hypothetical protein ACFQ3N_12700 [Virgibacillus byunsanensis]|uniref:DUF4064 domain-containing protein n=1 Tax=Virgibacillus byunsanensis TaxID=570945 RepID=A0ABW3LP31_9BACI
MNKTYIYLMGLIGSIIGILGSIIWIALGPSFLGGKIDSNLTDDALETGLLIAVIQSAITISFFIVTLVKSTPDHLDNELKKTGTWLLVVGIGNSLVNLFQLLPGILLITAGIFSIREAKMVDNDRPIEPDQSRI